MGHGNNKITNIEIDCKKFDVVTDRIDEISRRLDHLDGDYYISLEDAFRQVREAAKDLTLRLGAVECDLYSYLNQLNEASADESSESQDKILSGEFWDEIEQNNIFLQNLK